MHRTSMEVGCRVEIEHPLTRQLRYATKAYLTFVAIDGESKKRPVPTLELVTDEDRRRFAAAEKRRIDRLKAAGRNPT